MNNMVSLSIAGFHTGFLGGRGGGGEMKCMCKHVTRLDNILDFLN